MDTLGQAAFRSDGARRRQTGALYTTPGHAAAAERISSSCDGLARCRAAFEAAQLADLPVRPARRAIISRRAGTGRQCTLRAFDLDMMDLAPSPPAPPAQPLHTAAKTPVARAQAEADGDPLRSATASTGRRSITFGTPTEGVPERLMLKTPALRSRLGRTPGLAAAGAEVGMTPVEGVPERVTQRPAPTAVKAPRTIDPGPRVQPGLNAAPPVSSPERLTPGANSRSGWVMAAVQSGKVAAGPSPAQLCSNSDSVGCDAVIHSDCDEDGAELAFMARTSCSAVQDTFQP